MRLPNRKPGKYSEGHDFDPKMTEEKYRKLDKELEKLLKKVRPELAKEVNRLSLTGDFSENHAYQMAKGKLRGVNSRILELENILKQAEIIKPNKNNNFVQVGSVATVEVGGKQKVYQILGSAEVDPTGGAISHSSPLGSVLLGKRVGDLAVLKLKDREVEYKIIKIE